MSRIMLSLVTAVLLLLTGSVTPPATAAPSSQALGLAGQRITVCKGDFSFRVVVISAESRRTIADRTARPGFVWAVALADLTNLGQDYGYPQGLVSVQDSRGRLFDWVLFNGHEEYVEDQLANEYDVTPSWAGAEPGATTRSVLIFLVAADATGLTLVPNDLACSGNIVATTANTSGGTSPAPRPGPPAPASSAPPPPASSAPAPSGSARGTAASLAGQRVTACKDVERYRFSVVSADWRRQISDRAAPAGMMWAVAMADVTSLNADYGYFQGLVAVQDERGRTFDWVLFNGRDEYVENDIANEYDVTPSWAGVGSGSTLRVVIPFLVSANATSLTLVTNNVGCGG